MTGHRRSRAAASATAALLVAGLVLSASATSVSARPSVVLQQPTPDSTTPDSATFGAASIGDALGTNPSVSGDGRFVVYQGTPPVPVAAAGAEGETTPAAPRATTIYLTDRADGSTTEISPLPAGLRSGNSVRPVISGDGCSVAMISEMQLDVFLDDDDGARWDVYRSVLPHCDGTVGNWELVSSQNDGSKLARDDVSPDDTPAISRSGAIVAYVHPDERLFEADGVNTVTLVDLTVPASDPTRSTVVTGMPADRPNTTFVHVGVDQPALSDDGRFVAYRSDAASAEGVPVWGTGRVEGGRATQQVFVWDRDDADPFTAVRLVSARPDGAPTIAGAGEPALSRDGRFVAYSSADTGLAPALYPVCADECPTQVYRLDRDTDGDEVFDEPDALSTSIVSVEPRAEGAISPVAGTAASSQPTLSADGQLLAFVSKAPNLQLIQAPGSGEAGDGDILISDDLAMPLRRLTVSSDGVRPTVGAHARPQLSDSGRITVFDTLAAAQLVAGGAAPGRQVVALSTPPLLSLASADVGTTVVGLESTGWFVGLVNEGPSAFDPATVAISDGRFAIDEENSTCVIGTLVPAGGNCKVQFTFTPTSTATVFADLTIAEDGFEAVSVGALISGKGGEPALQIEPGGADLGTVTVGQAATEFLFDVSNIGFIPTSVAEMNVEGAHAGDFAITSNNCAFRPLNPRASCAVGITFTPSGEGRRTAYVDAITPEGQSTSVILAGDGQFAPELVIPVGEVVAGGGFPLGGNDYPANTELLIAYGDNTAEPIKVTTNDDGDFLVLVPVDPNERGGIRNVVVQSPTGPAAAVQIDVVADAEQYVGLPGFGLG